MAATEPAGELIEIGCDESGSEGENLLGGNTAVFAHASVDLTVAMADDAVREARDRIRSPATEYKAGHFLRARHRAVLMWLLAPSGPIHGHAHVHLIEKAFYAVQRLAELLLPGSLPSGTTTVMLDREARQVFGDERWTAFLATFVHVLRVTSQRGPAVSVDAFLDAVRSLHRDAEPGPLREVLGHVIDAAPQVEALRTRHVVGNPPVALLDPLVPAIAQTVRHWSQGGRPVAVVHDQQPWLTDERIALLHELVAAPPPGRLAGLRLVDSRSDARVQVADFLAGAAQRVASQALAGRGTQELTTLLRPYVDPNSVWGDEHSWSFLSPVE